MKVPFPFSINGVGGMHGEVFKIIDVAMTGVMKLERAQGTWRIKDFRYANEVELLEYLYQESLKGGRSGSGLPI